MRYEIKRRATQDKAGPGKCLLPPIRKRDLLFVLHSSGIDGGSFASFLIIPDRGLSSLHDNRENRHK